MYRQAGRRDDSLDAFLLAHPLAEHADDDKAEGIWRQKAAYLLVDLGRCDRAYEFVEEAMACFLLAGAEAELRRTMVDSGYVLSHAGRSKAALRRLKKALTLVPETDREYRFAIHQLLSLQLSRLGDHIAALRELELAEAFAAEDRIASATLNWSRAELAAKVGDISTAVEAYRTALRLYEKHGSEALVATLTFEFARLLVEQDRRPELLELTTDSNAWLNETKRNRKIQEALENFLALAAMKKLDLEALSKLRREIPVEQPTPAQKREKSQPPGGYSGPYSVTSPVAELLFGGKSAVPA